MATPTRHYSEALAGWAALVGVPASRITTELAASFNAIFNSALQQMWRAGPWLDICPNGEARFVGNRLTYPNDLTQTANWTATAATLTANSVQNPCDGGTTASKMMETAANSAHKVVQTVATFYPSNTYAASVYFRPNGRTYIQLACNDGVTTYSAFFNGTPTSGTVGTVSNTDSATIAAQPNGFYLARITFTANSAATTSGTYTVALSTDGATTSYAGDVTKGIYAWGNLIQQTSNVPLNDNVLPWDQTGENVIETVYDAWTCSPMAVNYPTRLTYNLTPGGIQLINAAPVAYNYYVNGVAQQSIFGAVPSNPVFISYRKNYPSFTGSAYSATATYAVGDQIFFTNSASNGDYWVCAVATSAGQSPDTTPASWTIIPLYDTFFTYCVYASYADWLISDGQFDKAAGAKTLAQNAMDGQFDRIERQMGQVMGIKVQTHGTAAQRWM